MDKRRRGKNLFRNTDAVRSGLTDFVTPPDPSEVGYQADRWPLSHPDVGARGQPKDGCAGLFSFNGTVLRSCFRLDQSPVSWQMEGGCRHSAALGLAEWLGIESHGGAVFVRSETGAIRILLARELVVSGMVSVLCN